MHWFVYIMLCSDKTLYTGITTDLNRRLEEHNGIRKNGARYTKGKRPVILHYFEEFPSRSTALVREAEIRKLSHVDKLALTR